MGRTRLQPRLVKRRLRRLVERRRTSKCLHVSRKITKRQPQRFVHQCLMSRKSHSQTTDFSRASRE